MITTMGQEDQKDNNTNTKRVRDEIYDSDCNSPVSKRARIDSHEVKLDIFGSGDSGFESDENGADSEDSDVQSRVVKRIQDDLLNILDNLDEPAIHGLDSVIKSFEEEILVADPAMVGAVEQLASLSGGSQPDLGYLLEASDDELGLPPKFSCAEEEKIGAVDFEAASGPGAVGLGEMLGFEDEIPSFESFEFGLECNSEGNGFAGNYNDGGDFVALGGLFDHSDENFVVPDKSGFHRRPESLWAS